MDSKALTSDNVDHSKTPLMVICFQQSMIMSLLAHRLESGQSDNATSEIKTIIEHLYLSAGWIKDLQL